MTTKPTASQTTPPPRITLCVTCCHRNDEDHDCTIHRCVMSEHGGRVVVHECDGYKATEEPIQNL